ncbi:Uncharacterized conserved protein, DUF2236 family [Nocardia amikacinitolerans]|uniref:oxygenase MpaB family protein n=1 Tax=Nocardia amikacinitolerans TaxID=756689 RepID=UPI0020A5F5EF|nr:oxygenase MpaB family protein [Nocardia amikacinitolerans]MCP2299487.1 Uncharacterized conserved protein, DUF2236 family [Nocardia amikacinitolerans]
MTDLSHLVAPERTSASLLHRYLGDRRFALALPRAVALQILHPAIAAGLVEHTHVRLWEHKKRTVSSMITIAYSSRDLRSLIRYGHEHVKGVDDAGRRYHALHPEVFFFQHATYVDTLVTAIETFARPLTALEHERLYAECCDWYDRYGISTRHVPQTWPQFTEYFADACDSMLRRSAHSDRLAAQVLRPDAWIPRRLPDFAVRALQHERARELLDVRSGTADRAALEVYAGTVRTAMAAAPPRIRLVRQARPAK